MARQEVLDQTWKGTVLAAQTKGIQLLYLLLQLLLSIGITRFHSKILYRHFKRKLKQVRVHRNNENYPAELQGDFPLVSYAGKGSNRFFGGQVD
jgi:hypothetical protein